MPTDERLSPPVQSEAGSLIEILRNAGWTVVDSQYSAQHFGNWLIDLTRDRRSIRLTRDRSQFIVDGPVEELKSAGLFKAFDEWPEFQQAVIAWAGRPWA